MKITIISYNDLNQPLNPAQHQPIIDALLNKGIIGVSDVPDFIVKSRAYVNAVMQFSKLPDDVKNKYKPDRDAGCTEGYELGAEWFKNEKGEWQTDDKKASYYAYIPDNEKNLWPQEVDLKTPYLELGALIFSCTKRLLKMLRLDESVGVHESDLLGHGRMLHYHKESDVTNANPDWCGAHYDHSIITGLMPAYYFQDGVEIPEPEEAGLHIIPTHESHFEKVVADPSILLFQVAEFGQLISNDRIKATRHIVKKSEQGVERIAFAVFCNIAGDYTVRPTSVLTEDKRFIDRQRDGAITYADWAAASFERYRVI
jgi:isopenicillin N synthase-like dioxygenase